MSTSSPIPEFMCLQVPDAARAGEAIAAAETFVREAGGMLLASGGYDGVELLEQGTPAAAVLIARWPSRDAFDAGWKEFGAGLEAAASAASGSLLVAVPGLPVEGLPEQPAIPTVASVVPPASAEPPTYMLIQGRVFDQSRIDQYRDIILPMIAERGAYYIVFSLLPGEVRALVGAWTEQIFAISRWATHASAHDFWYCERYQKLAIPTRTGAGAFLVHLLRGERG
ncbi:MAG TPA: DUF1330 domain-containing protein [Steroidobacteraceae bacterium]|nr:DUF1330 domain-containing protein [Steroidobacteraceae bacterium]